MAPIPEFRSTEISADQTDNCKLYILMHKSSKIGVAGFCKIMTPLKLPKFGPGFGAGGSSLSKTNPKPITYPKLIPNLSKTYPEFIQNLPGARAHLEFVTLRALWPRAPTGFSCFRALPSRANLRVLGLGLLWPLWGPSAWKPGVLDFEPWRCWGPRVCCGAWDPRACCGACLSPGPVVGPGTLGPRA